MDPNPQLDGSATGIQDPLRRPPTRLNRLHEKSDTLAEAARRNKCSQTLVAKWRDQSAHGRAAALEAGPSRGPSGREAQLERELVAPSSSTST